ncbi:thiamine diphosphokinase [Lentibacillus sp. N15]|uniref:thiamine diphosphokinase n=1 Tax=Lentibacillus songyuanensis TaxID=3136161 RepID=UPI0031BAC1A0
MTTVAIVGNGPAILTPDLTIFKDIDIWIGADRGAFLLIENQYTPDIAIGDFDSLNKDECAQVKQYSRTFIPYPIEKDWTDLELALGKAYEYAPEKIYLFNVTGGRLDHSLINIQTLYSIMERKIQGFIVENNNLLTMVKPGKHAVVKDDTYPFLSFVPFTKDVKGLTLQGFEYPLADQTITWGSTRCISNKLLLKNGTFSFKEGILLLIKSRDATKETIPKNS